MLYDRHFRIAPVTEGILYAGTDDGLIQAATDGPNGSRPNLPGLPERVFINDVEASLYDADTVLPSLTRTKGG
jgi:hypothetical protein